tara:strand:+ start:148 stop:1032 length:885 start_codon:yes stop_codon:yes gene_type:complete
MEYIDRREITKQILHINKELSKLDPNHRNLSERMINNIPIKIAIQIIEEYNKSKPSIKLDKYTNKNCLKNKSLSLKQLQELLINTNVNNSSDKLFLCRTLIDYGYNFKDNNYIINKYEKENDCNNLSKPKCLKNIGCVYNNETNSCDNRIVMNMPYSQLIKLYGVTLLLNKTEFKIDNKDINLVKFNIIHNEIYIKFLDTFKYNFIKFIYTDINVIDTNIFITLKIYKKTPLIIYNLNNDEIVIGLENNKGYNPKYIEYLSVKKQKKETYLQHKNKLKQKIMKITTKVNSLFGI